MIRTIAVTLALLTCAGEGRAEEASPSGRYVVQLLNVDPGGELFMRFGHIAVIVEDRKLKTKEVYNFGTFDFTDPNLQFRYARGFLNYWLSVVPLPPMVSFYRAMGRGVTVRTLNLTPSQAEEIVKRLEINALPENATYAYRHYIDNCCTRIRDLLDDVLDGAISEAYRKGPTGRTYRYWTYQCLLGMPVMRTVILLILSGEIDKPIDRWEEEFLPAVFAEDLDNLRFGSEQKPVVLRKDRLFKSRGPNPGEYTSPSEILTFVILFALLLVGFSLPIALPKKKWTARFAGLGLTIWGFTGGFGGLLLLFLWTATTHYDTHKNENLLTFLVLHLWLLGPGLKLLLLGRVREKTAYRMEKYLIFSLALIALDLVLKLGPFIQSNFEYLAFAAACNTGALLAIRRLRGNADVLQPSKTKKKKRG